MVDITLPRAVGADGVSPNLTAGSVTAGPLAVSITGTQANPVLNFVIPAGTAPPFAISDTTGLQTALDAKANTSALASYAPLASPTFTGTVTLPAGQVVNGVTLSTAAGTTVFLRGDGTYATPSGGGGGGGGDVVGPAAATNNGVALFDGTTGKLLKDGPLLSTYALLASPTFTGTPAAPTATAGTSTTQLATTAFVTTADNLKAPLASPTFTGTPAAPTASAGTNTTQVATTAFVTTAVLDAKPIEAFGFALSDTTTAITTGTAKLTVRMPYAFTLLSGAAGVRASLSTASSSGIPTVDINENGTTILSTKLTIDATEKTSTTAAVPAVISDTSLADDAEITFDIDVAGTGAVGLVVWLIGRRT